MPPKLAAASKRLALAVGLFVALGVTAVLFWFNPAQYSFYPACLFHKITGWNCPGCGGLRAAHQLLHGHFALAVKSNALAILLLPLLAWWGVCRVKARRRQGPSRMLSSAKWLWAFLALGIVFGVLRNLPAFTWLAP